MKYLTSFILITCFLTLGAQTLRLGKWKGVITYQLGEVPFIFEVAPGNEDIPQIMFINGDERIRIENSVIEGDSIFIPLAPFDVEIRAKFTAMSMEGIYVKYYRGISMPFSASIGDRRYAKKSIKPSPKIEKRWKMTFSPDSPSKSNGVGLFTQIGERVVGTVLTETSDYRYFEGITDGDSLKLSSFDGAHAFMILGKWLGEDRWEGTIIFDNTYSESWSASYDSNAELDDPFEMVTIEPGTHKPYYDLLGAGSGPNSIDPTKYEGKVLVIQLFGTWCPNSLDQTKYLVNWYEENASGDLAILASSFEANYSQEYGLKRLEAYRESNNIPYDMVLGGRLSKTSAATPFPFMKRIKAFPTLVICDKSGYVRYVHSYFNGPATGEYYQAFDRRFNQIIEELLAE